MRTRVPRSMAFSLRLQATGGRDTVEAKKFAPPASKQLSGDIPGSVQFLSQIAARQPCGPPAGRADAARARRRFWRPLPIAQEVHVEVAAQAPGRPRHVPPPTLALIPRLGTSPQPASAAHLTTSVQRLG